MSDENSKRPTIEKTPYELLGGEQHVRELVDLFYDIMDQEPQFSTLRKLHAKSLKASREKLFLFLSGLSITEKVRKTKFITRYSII